MIRRLQEALRRWWHRKRDRYVELVIRTIMIIILEEIRPYCKHSVKARIITNIRNRIADELKNTSEAEIEARLSTFPFTRGLKKYAKQNTNGWCELYKHKNKET